VAVDRLLAAIGAAGSSGLFGFSGLFRLNGWAERETKETVDQMNKSDERHWCDARLVDLAYLIEEKQRDLESAFSVWPAAFSVIWQQP
jgi:hypothetical protein